MCVSQFDHTRVEFYQLLLFLCSGVKSWEVILSALSGAEIGLRLSCGRQHLEDPSRIVMSS